MTKKLSAKQKIGGIVAFGVLLVVVPAFGSIYNLIHNKREVRRLIKKREFLDKQYQALLAERKRLEEQDPAYMELLARTRYNMVKPGEIEFRFNIND